MSLKDATDIVATVVAVIALDLSIYNVYINRKDKVPRLESNVSWDYVSVGANEDEVEGRLFIKIINPGDEVVWWKRIPGGDYVYPVAAVVIALTAKRVKIQGDDDGEIVIRFVPPESLQKREPV